VIRRETTTDAGGVAGLCRAASAGTALERLNFKVARTIVGNLDFTGIDKLIK